MSVKFVVTGDLHFRSENPRNRKDIFEDAMLCKLYEVFEIAKDNGAKAIIIPGDIFDTVNVSLKTIAKLGYCLNCWKYEFGIDVLSISGNHDLPASNKGALDRTPFGLLYKLGLLVNIEDLYTDEHLINIDGVNITGCGFDFMTDTEEGQNQFLSKSDPNCPTIHVVHSMLLPVPPLFPMRHTLIEQAETSADIIISGHYHNGFGIIRRNDGKLFINPGALCRLSASETEMSRTVQVALLTVWSKTNFDAELIALKSARPAEEVLDREAIVDKKEHENWLQTFFESLSQEGEAKFLEVREIIDSIASREKISLEVRDEALRRIGEAREKLGRVVV